MSCNNTNSTCTNCNHNYSSCNNKCAKCGCKDSFLTSPPPCSTPNGCPDPVPCQEVLSSDCVIYTGDPIMCDDIVIIPSDSTMTEALIALANFMCECCGGPPGPVTSYNCVNNECVLVSGPGGQYLTLALCQDECTPLVTSYNCIDGDCVHVCDNTGQYKSLFVCEAFCEPPPCENTIFMTFNRISGPWLCDAFSEIYQGCIEVGAGLGWMETKYICELESDNSCDYPVGTWNCIDGACVDPGDGTGTFDFYTTCWFACVNPIPRTERDVYTIYSYYDCLLAVPFTYNCVNGTCQSVTGSGGTYATLAACTLDCTSLPTTSYNCVSGNCEAVSGSGGIFPTLPACLSNCMQPPPCENTIFMTFKGLYNPSWNCIGTSCIDPGDGTGIYSTLSACTTYCTPPSVTSYICNAGFCLPVIGTGGTYATLALCQNECIPPAPLTWDMSFRCIDNAPNMPNPIVTNINVTGGVSPYCFGTQAFTTQVAALANIVWNPCADPVAANYSLNNGTWWVVLKDATGTLYTQSIIANCPPSIKTYNCVNCLCNTVDGPVGQFQTLDDCLLSGCNDVFTTTWETTTAGESITLPYNALGIYAGTIDWGDSTTSANSFATSTHIYATPGTYTVTICGRTVGWNFNTTPASRSKIKSVVTWGQLSLGADIGNYFALCNNLDLSSVTDTLDLTGITDLSAMFLTCTSLTTVNNINSWNTTAVTTMAGMFRNCTNFNQPLTFNTAAVTNMFSMFYGCTAFNSLLNFTTSAVTNMSQMFMNCTNFNTPINFDTIAVTTMLSMFRVCSNFNSAVSFTSTPVVTNMSRMFEQCVDFDQPLTFNTPLNITTFRMFANCISFNSPLIFTNTGSVTTMQSMFLGCSVFNQPLTLNTSAVINMSAMFADCTVFNSPLTFSSTASVQLMDNMFNAASAFNNASIVSWNTGLVEDMRAMFFQATAFNIPIGSWNTGAVTNMFNMFYNATAFQQNIGSWTITSVTDFTGFMAGKTPATWSTTNFDNLLCAWKLQTVNPSLTISFGSAQFTNATGLACKNVLTNPPNLWNITDGGGV